MWRQHEAEKREKFGGMKDEVIYFRLKYKSISLSYLFIFTRIIKEKHNKFLPPPLTLFSPFA